MQPGADARAQRAKRDQVGGLFRLGALVAGHADEPVLAVPAGQQCAVEVAAGATQCGGLARCRARARPTSRARLKLGGIEPYPKGRSPLANIPRTPRLSKRSQICRNPSCGGCRCRDSRSIATTSRGSVPACSTNCEPNPADPGAARFRGPSALLRPDDSLRAADASTRRPRRDPGLPGRSRRQPRTPSRSARPSSRSSSTRAAATLAPIAQLGEPAHRRQPAQQPGRRPAHRGARHPELARHPPLLAPHG